MTLEEQIDLTELESPYAKLKEMAERANEGDTADLYKTITPMIVMTLIEDRDQQYDMKVKAREQRDSVTTKMKAAQAENLRLLRMIIGTEDKFEAKGHPFFAADMTLRDHFAGLALQAYISAKDPKLDNRYVAVWAYNAADEMMMERLK